MVFLWVWFLWVVLQNHFVVEMVSVSYTPKPLDVLNGFLWSSRVHMTIKNQKHMEFSNHNRTFSKPSDSGINFEFLATESQFSEKFPIWFRHFLKPGPSSIFPINPKSNSNRVHFAVEFGENISDQREATLAKKRVWDWERVVVTRGWSPVRLCQRTELKEEATRIRFRCCFQRRERRGWWWFHDRSIIEVQIR